LLDFIGMPLVIEPSPGQLSRDSGLLPVRQFDQRVGLTRAFADALDDPRDPGLAEHSFPEMVRSRVYGLLADRAAAKEQEIVLDALARLNGSGAQHPWTPTRLSSGASRGVGHRNVGRPIWTNCPSGLASGYPAVHPNYCFSHRVCRVGV
jgi:hypothetical protein